MYGDHGGHHDAHSQLAPDNPTLEACYGGASKSPFFKSSLTEHILCVFCVYAMFMFCALLSRRVCGTGKGATGMLLFRQGTDMAQRALLGCGKTPLSPPESTPSHHNKHPAICRSVGDATQLP